MIMDNKETTRLEYDESKLGHNLWRIRNDRQLTVERLAEIVNVSPRFITQIESGERLGSIPTILKIANALDVTLGSLFM